MFHQVRKDPKAQGPQPKAPEPPKASSTPSSWVESDFPRAPPPPDCALSFVQWRQFKACMIKAEVPPQDCTDEQLRAAGYNSWKQYIITTWPLNWA